MPGVRPQIAYRCQRQGKALRRMRRDALNRTQDDIAAITSGSGWPGVAISQSKLSRLESGETDLTLLELESLARAYGYDGREHEMIRELRQGV